jgi:bloom syndrome protein
VRKLNREIFGNHTFRTNQEEVINANLCGRDCFVLMPTGGGKSLCYQLPALVQDGLTVVFSPLVSLIQDQCDQLAALDLAAGALTGSTDPETYKAVMRDAHQNILRLLYITPEKLAKSSSFWNFLTSLNAKGNIRLSFTTCRSQYLGMCQVSSARL